MKQDPQFTAILQQWMNTPDPQKDWAEGAVLLLQLSGNQIMYRNISFNPKGKAEFINGQLQKYLNFRLQQLTHDQVNDMQAQVDEIVKKVIKPNVSLQPADANPDASIKSVGANPNGSVNPDNSGKSEEFADFKAGKRSDHDQLPAEIQALYVENLDIVHRMRELHLKLRTLSLDNATCPDSERYPFLKEIISLDKRLHDNWDAYDHFVISQSPASIDETTVSENDKESTDTSNVTEQDIVSKEVTESVDQLAQSKTADQPAQLEKPKKVAKTSKSRKKAPLLKD